MSTWQGDIYSASYTASQAATVVLTVTAPDGTTSTPTVVTTGAPTYTADVTGSQTGTYLLVWSASGALTDVFVDQFTVVAPALALVSFTELKDQLNISTSDTTGTAKLRRFMQSATDVVQNLTGNLLGQSRTVYFDGGCVSVVLPDRWVQSITTVTEVLATMRFTLTEQPLGAGNYTQYGYTWDRITNKIIRRGSGLTYRFPPGNANVAVTYRQGISPLPQVISDAAGELIRIWWQDGQQPRSISFANPALDDDSGTVVLGYWVPRRVVGMLEPYMLGPALV